MSSNKIMLSSLVKKYIMAITGLFLVLFLIVHCGINALIFLNDGGKTFNEAAHFMGHNILMRIMEIGLFVGFIIHIVDGLTLWFQNRSARAVGYAKVNPRTNSTWYSRSMGFLGTIILIFLIIHLKDFWFVSRFLGLEMNEMQGLEDLFVVMTKKFQSLPIVVIYELACFSLAYHLLHGFSSAFQSLGINNPKYNGIIKKAAIVYSIVISFVFAAMPLAMYLQFIK
jgi:succinate dehydrogenase / fumarate reductase cytochrome b subunit